MVLSAVTLRSETTEGSSTGPAPALPPAPYYPPGYPYSSSQPATYPPGSTPGYSQYTFYNYGPAVVGSISLPYAFNWNALGVSGELGGLWMGQHFFGAEISYYGGDAQRYDVYNPNGTYAGHFYSDQDITTVDFAYRYFAPLSGYGPHAPVSFYIGGSAGVGFVDYSNNGSAFGFHNDATGTFTGEALAGLQFNPQPGVGIRIGYRYVFVNDAWRVDERVNLDSSALEASLSFRF